MPGKTGPGYDFIFLYNVKAKIILFLAACACASGAAAADFAVPNPGGGRFLLLDRPDSGRIMAEPAVSTAAESGGIERISGELPFSYSEDSWNSVREAVETGRFRSAELAPPPAIGISTDTPLAPEPQVEFKESGTTLSVTGRKVIALSYSGKRYINDQISVTRPKSLSLFEITQQMQVRMQGKVGAKISVNVDYDDTKQDKQDISVVYQGDPNEVVQNVSFGDIDLSLPATEFVSYNKQLFGIRADLKTQRLKFTFVGSRTKGQTKTRQFTGNTQFQGADILDTNYLRRKYYDVTFGNTLRLPIKSGTERIYIDQQTLAQVDNVTVFGLVGKDMAVQTSTYTGRFQLLSPGIDYVMDYVKGLVTFNRTLNPQDVVLIDYQNLGGSYLAQNSSPGSLDTTAAHPEQPAIIKTPSDIELSSVPAVSSLQVSHLRELKTYYSIGQSNIVRDNGTGNFTVKVQDLNRNAVQVPGYNPAYNNPTVKYPDTIEVDFEQGIINLKNPFLSETSTFTVDNQIYSAAPSSKRIIRVEYSYRFKTFLLEPNIVLQSEVVRVDGKKLGRNEEYFIDYDSGFITFYYPDRIGQEAKIDITYEVSPFGGVGNQSLVGGRISYDFGSHFSLGSTMLYQGGIKSNSVPNVTDLTNSMLVYEGDAQLKGMNLLGLRTSLAAEAAQSRLNPNLNDLALIDNMEGVKQEDSPSMDKNYWFIAANPTGDPADPAALDWNSENVKLLDINPAASSDGTQQVLSINYNFSVSSQVSIVYPLSATGIDFSQKNLLELMIYGQNGTAPGTEGPRISLHLGQINEDADGRGGSTFVCTSGLVLNNAPKSEDANCDAQVSNSEDVGWLYAPATSANTRRYGANNGRLDSEDLNKNGRLDAQDFTGGSFGYVNGSKFTDKEDPTNPKDSVDFAGWHLLSIPMPISSTDTYKWNAIKQVRISLRQATGGATSGTIKFARISAVGNTWSVQAGTAPAAGALQATAVNNQDNVYTPIYDAGGEASTVFTDLYGSVSKQKEKTNAKMVIEQTLAVTYSNISSTATAYVYRKFTRAIDVAQHGKLRFLLKSESALTPGASFYIKAGDENSYFKAVVPLDFTGWKLITINQDDLTGDKIPDVWAPGTAGVEISSRGAPSLQQIPQFIIGVTAAPGNVHSGTLYFNELHVADPLTRVGNARKVEGSFEVPGWFSFGGKHRFVDRNFQTPVTAIANQDNESQSGYLNVTRLAFFPVSVTAARQITVTPNALATGSNNLVNSLQQGRVKKFDGTAAGSINIGALPRLGLNYSKGITDYNLLSRKDDRDLYAASLSYSIPGSLPVLPRSLSLNYSLGMSRVNYDASRLLNLSGLYDTSERTDAYGARLTFIPWNGASFNPGYGLQTAREERKPLASPLALERYPKSLQQTVDFNSNFMLARWFNPSVNYSVSTIEGNNLNTTTVTVAQSSAVFTAGQIKSVNRTAQGGVNLTISMNDLMPSNRLLRSLVLSSNYQIQDGDSWQNVEKDYNTRNKLWVRDSLKPANYLAQRNSITLRDTVSSSQRWQPFEGYGFKGPAASLNTLSVTNNFTNSVQRSEVTGTTSKSVNRTFPDMILSLSQLELLTRTKSWAQGVTVNLKYSRNTNEAKKVSLDASDTYGMDLRFKLLNWVDTASSYNLRLSDRRDLRVNQRTGSTRHDDATLQGTFDYRKFHFTSKVDYANDRAKGALGVVTQNTRTITPSLLIKSDFQLPKGLKLPFMKRTIIFTNRIVWTTTLNYAIKSSPITIAENNRLFTLNSSADYEAAKNLRLTFNAGLQRLWHKYLKQEEYLSYQAGSTLTFQF
ncbi:MAG TPA: hypothetical protein DCS63_03670 [Elusimicrobia bacterium]|nr:hypothetical protein [Elusimicrobiota bacterium]